MNNHYTKKQEKSNSKKMLRRLEREKRKTILLNGLDLFSGIGGISLALDEWVRPIAYCEIETYCQAVLLSRMAKNDLATAPIWDDIRTLDGKQFNGIIDIVYGGFPCQDISIAGTGKGLAGERSGLFYEIIRLCREIEPRFIFLENVPAITSRGGAEVVREITAMGYDCRWCTISAASIGALHKRKRWFLLAYTRRERRKKRAYENIQSSSKKPKRKNINQLSWGNTMSEMGKLSDGIPYHVDRLRALGNSVVPAQAKKAFKILVGLS